MSLKICAKCDVAVEGLACALCGTPVDSPMDPGAQKKAVLDLHERILKADKDGKINLLRNGFIPDDPDVLIDAGVRVVPLLDMNEPGESAAYRLEAILLKLKLMPPTSQTEEAVREFGRVLKAQRRADRALLTGCFAIAAILVALGIWLAVKFLG